MKRCVLRILSIVLIPCLVQAEAGLQPARSCASQYTGSLFAQAAIPPRARYWRYFGPLSEGLFRLWTPQPPIGNATVDTPGAAPAPRSIGIFWEMALLWALITVRSAADLLLNSPAKKYVSGRGVLIYSLIEYMVMDAAAMVFAARGIARMAGAWRRRRQDGSRSRMFGGTVQAAGAAVIFSLVGIERPIALALLIVPPTDSVLSTLTGVSLRAALSIIALAWFFQFITPLEGMRAAEYKRRLRRGLWYLLGFTLFWPDVIGSLLPLPPGEDSLRNAFAPAPLVLPLRAA